jgi:hypothetical protein
MYEILYGGAAPRPWVLFLSGLLMSWSVVARYTNVLVVALFALHFGISRCCFFFKGRCMEAVKQTAPFLSGITVSMCALLVYNYAVFGSALDYGYRHSRFSINFVFTYFFEANPQSGFLFREIIRGNLRNLPVSLLAGFPVLAVALPGMAYAAWRKARGVLKRLRNKPLKISGQHLPEIPFIVRALLISWFLAVYGLYFLYEWTSTPLMETQHFMTVVRFYHPGLFPLVIITALILAHAPKKPVILLITAFVIFGIVLFLQSPVVSG